MGRYIVYYGIRLLLLIRPFISSFSFLSNFHTLKFFVTLFSETVRPGRLNLGTQVDSGQMYRVYRNQAATAYLSLYFYIFLSFQFSNLKNFRHTFLRKYEAWKVDTCFTSGQWADVSCIPESDCCCLFISFTGTRLMSPSGV